MLRNARAENIFGMVAGNLLCSMHFPCKYILYNIYNSYKCFCLQRKETNAVRTAFGELF